ncbi:hypothetical protein EK904_014456 [Melospiza melodia maxima]|nr:hypothetical protein EK904_014456 [Melospiza melodia maxima]
MPGELSVDIRYEKPPETNCETKGSVFSDDEENDCASLNKRPKKKDPPLEVLPYCQDSSFYDFNRNLQLSKRLSLV